MAEGYECDRCGSLHSGEPHTRIKLGDGVPRARPRGYERVLGREEGTQITDEGELYDVCPGCRSAFETWWDGPDA